MKKTLIALAALISVVLPFAAAQDATAADPTSTAPAVTDTTATTDGTMAAADTTDGTITSAETPATVDETPATVSDATVTEETPAVVADDSAYTYAPAPLKLTKDMMLHPTERIFEFGVSAEAGLANNYFAVSDILVKNLVFDLREIADKMPSYGFAVNAFAEPDVFMNLNLTNGVHIGFKTGVEADGAFVIDKGIFDFLGYGNDKSSYTFAVAGAADAYYYLAFSTGFKLFDKYYLTVTPSLFAPLVHAEASDVGVKFNNTTDGSVALTATAAGTIYSFFDINAPSYDSETIIRSLMQSFGFDLSTSFEMPLFSFLEGGAYLRLPIVPGHMKYASAAYTSLDYNAASLQEIISGNATKKQTNLSMTTESADYALSRPFRFGIEAALRPFGYWLTLSGSGGVAAKYPYSSNIKWYPEYSLGYSMNLFRILGFTLSSSYQSQVFIQELEVMISCHILEIKAAVASEGADFINSFKGTGIDAQLSITMGF